jgi:4-hydroxy-4-methyl-2-oxoglutarate aldolase
MTNTEEAVDRLAALYVSAVSDVLDEMGYRDQCFPLDLRPLTTGATLAGIAFTVRGRPLVATPDWDPRYRQIEMLEALPPRSVIVLDPGNDERTAHWGELMSATAAAAGSRGAIVNGGVRDASRIREMSYPVLARFLSPRTAVWRWELTDFQEPIQVGQLTVTPGDLIIADDDGALCIPQAIGAEVLDRAEDVRDRERRVSDGLAEGQGIRALFETHRAL